jgi:hypothetical protein
VLAVRLKLDVEQVRILGRDMLRSTLRRARFERPKPIGETNARPRPNGRRAVKPNRSPLTALS